jgi:hypothetical protein
MTDAREIVFWTTTEFEEQLTHRSRHDAVTQWLDDNPQIKPRQMPSTIKVYGWARMEISPAETDRIASFALEHAVEQLDEEHGDFIGGEGHEHTKKMKEAAVAFARAVVAEYQVWACEQIVEEDYNLEAHIAEIEQDSTNIGGRQV